MKVFGGLIMNEGKQCRAIVAAQSQKRAVEILNERRGGHISLHEFRNYWCETGNPSELKVATREGAWISSKSMTGDSADDYQPLAARPTARGAK